MMSREKSMRVGLAALSMASVLAGCGGIQVAPSPKLPHALIAQIPSHVGIVVPGDMRNYSHKESRGGVSWAVTLGPGHEKFSQHLFSALFQNAEMFTDLAKARAAPGLAAIFESRIEQFSFATAQETGGAYFAVTIRYRFNLTTPSGEPVDSFTLTGYGNSLAGGMSSSAPLDLATQSAMRDAAAKFLVQFPDQAVAKQLAKAQPLLAQTVASIAAAHDPIEAVPIK